MFVFAIMVMAGTRPILQLAARMVHLVAMLLPVPRSAAIFFVTLSLVPLLGSFITEPAAMTLAALLLRNGIYAAPVSEKLKYGALGVLFVNVSIGGTLTNFAAPPVLMVAEAWNWNLAFMIEHIGDRAALAVVVNAAVLTLLFRRELATVSGKASALGEMVPWPVMVVHVAFLAGVAAFSHHPPVFMGLFLFFLGFTHAYERYQNPLLLREALMVAFFLAGLVVLGGLQRGGCSPADVHGRQRGVLRCHGADRGDRQRRADLPGLAGARPEPGVQDRPGHRGGDGRRADPDRQRPQPGRRRGAQGQLLAAGHPAAGAAAGRHAPTLVAIAAFRLF
jgi:hypothetical protein